MLTETRSLLLGVPVGVRSLHDITTLSLRAIEQRGPQVRFACANPHSLVVAQKDQEFLQALNGTPLVVADGIGIKLAGALLGLDVGPRITGHAYFESVLDALQQRGGGRVFFFGSSPEVLQRIAVRFRQDYPALKVCGTLSPPYRPWTAEENARMVADINAAKPDVLWVGMTAPKQEKWVHANRDALEVPVIGSIGAVFDFYAGTHPRAPRWICRLGLEWAYRLIQEPRRMWRRTFVSAPRFLGRVLASRLSRAG